MAQKKAILDKVARNLGQLGLTVSRDSDNVIIDNGANDFTISLVDASIQLPMGGIDGSVSPFLGIGVAAPSKIKMKSSIATAGTIADVMDSVIALKVLHELCGFANNIVVENSTASFSAELAGSCDVIGLGQ